MRDAEWIRTRELLKSFIRLGFIKGFQCEARKYDYWERGDITIESIEVSNGQW